MNYVIDVDIEGFFDNVNHGKLLKQIWSLGIQDKNLLCIISKMLKAPIKGIGIPTKGTPQGGILSPILANIYLNELDWWVSNQWENIPTKYQFKKGTKKKNDNSSKKVSLRRNTKLKEMYIVRYADDFKIFTRSYNDAYKTMKALEDFISKRLKLNLSKEKTGITNLRKNYSEFLGFKFKAEKKKNKYYCKSNISNKAKESIIKKIIKRTEEIKEDPSVKTVSMYNSSILGIHNYYRIATHVNIDFNEIHGKCKEPNKAYLKYYKDYKGQKYTIHGIRLYPVGYIQTKTNLNFTQEICNYTEIGRSIIHNSLKKVSDKDLEYLSKNPIPNKSIEYNDNRISKYVSQEGKCKILKQKFELQEMECHHIKPSENGGTDEYKNLVFVNKHIHKLFHMVDIVKIKKYINALKLNEEMIKSVNTYRLKAENTLIEI